LKIIRPDTLSSMQNQDAAALPAKCKAFYSSYGSSIDHQLRLFAQFTPAAEPAPMLINMHGWHGNIKDGHTDNVDPCTCGRFTMIAPEMRGRGDSSGRPDANGWELYDGVDVLDACRRSMPAAVSSSAAPRLWGGSGGGSNVLGLLGKFPDLFSAAVCEVGVSDFGLWFLHDAVGEFCDEMEGAGWIGGNPTTRPEAYLSRGGRTTAMNLLTPLLMIYGMADPRVPFEQATVYLDAARAHQRDHLITTLFFPGVGHPGHYGGLDEAGHQKRQESVTAHLNQHGQAPQLPEKGTLVVAGYLVTKRFAVMLESVDCVALLEYDLSCLQFTLHAPSSRTAKIWMTGCAEWDSMECQPLPLADIKKRLRLELPY
jgi:pimeloyl-ACP methyl ester carboxylesterase